MKKIELMFYRVNPSEQNVGLKHVLWEIITPESEVKYDWGFGYWDGSEWGKLDLPEEWSAQAHSWANTVNPEVLLKEPSKIIT